MSDERPFTLGLPFKILQLLCTWHELSVYLKLSASSRDKVTVLHDKQ